MPLTIDMANPSFIDWALSIRHESPAASRENDEIRAKASDQSILNAEDRWNATADEYNQWDALGQDEKDELISAEQRRLARPEHEDSN